MPQHQPLASHRLDSLYCARAISGLARVVFVVKLREIQTRVFLADVMVCAINRALAVSEETLNCIGRSQPACTRIKTRIFFVRVVDHIVSGKLLADLFIEARFIGIQGRFQCDVLLEKFGYFLAVHEINNGRAHAAIAFNERNNSRLVADICATVTALLAAYIRFVCFNCAAEQVARRGVRQRETDAMAQEPRRAIRTKLKLTLICNADTCVLLAQMM